MLHWNRTTVKYCNGVDVNNAIQNYVNEYKTNVVFVPPTVNSSAVHVVEVWFNFQVRKYIITVYEKPDYYDETGNEPTII